MPKYEYLIVHLPFAATDPGNVQYLNRHGDLGWELVSAAAFSHRVRTGTRIEHIVEQVCYFKRPLVEAPHENAD